MELLRVKLNRIWGICQIEADCTGITVIPPGNFRISNIDVFPKIVGVKVRFNCWRKSSIKEDLSTLRDTGFIGTFVGSERTPNTTSVQLDAPDWCMDKMATYWKQVNGVNFSVLLQVVNW
jgi:hypothetical protein